MKHVKVLKKLLSFLVAAIVFLVVGLNIFSSQQISPLYLGLVSERKSSLIKFLKKTISLPQSKEWLKTAEKKYGRQLVENAVFADRKKAELRIKKLEQLLKKNPNARDVLYGLSVIYRQLDNDKMANIYLERAKKVDPQIEGQSLVKIIN